MQKLNEALRLLRVFHDLKQTEAATLLQISAPHISQLESGGKTASLEVVRKYADIFQIPPSSIFLLAERIDSGDFSYGEVESLVPRKVLTILDWMRETQKSKEAPPLKKPVYSEKGASGSSKPRRKAS